MHEPTGQSKVFKNPLNSVQNARGKCWYRNIFRISVLVLKSVLLTTLVTCNALPPTSYPYPGYDVGTVNLSIFSHNARNIKQFHVLTNANKCTSHVELFVALVGFAVHEELFRSIHMIVSLATC